MPIEPSKFAEIWVEKDDGSAMCALINGDLGWLMYLRQAGDAGFSSRNPEYDGPSGTLMEFQLNNGQMDEYPVAWTIPIQEIQRALDYFKRTGKPPSFITWHNDSGDGTVIGGVRCN